MNAPLAAWLLLADDADACVKRARRDAAARRSR